MNKKEFVNIMTGICEIYEKTPSEFIFDTYYTIFQGYEVSQFSSAVNKCIRSRVYSSLPKPAEILEYLEGTKDDKALIGWLKAKEAVKKAGYYESVEFDDPIISRCISEFGGWMEFCSIQLDELPFAEKRFLDLYRIFLKREIKEPVCLSGFTATTNNNLGFNDKIPKPIKIGFDDVVTDKTKNIT